ncbi:MAG: hypothetical protein L6Q84_21560 [Polyangiaceae bacterium]|nr:hypothetical protein [Polyangiaceae bacterium]
MAWNLLSLKATLARPAAWRGLLAALVALALTASCSGDDDGRSPKKPALPNPDTEWAVHVYVGEPGAWKRFDFGPVPEVSFPAGPFDGAGALPGSPADLWNGPPNPSETSSKGGKAPGSKAQAVVDAKDGGVQIDQTLSTESKSWALVAGAAAQCQPDVRLGPATAALVPPWRASRSAEHGCGEERHGPRGTPHAGLGVGAGRCYLWPYERPEGSRGERPHRRR